MPLLIASLRFTNLAGAYYDFVPNANHRVTRFAGAINARGAETSRMGMHGYNARRTLFEGLQISQEGKLLIPDGTLEAAGAALIEERDDMLEALLGNLATVPTTTSMGTLKVKLAGWAHTASAAAQVSSWSADLTAESVRTAEYMIGWTLQTPYLVDDVDNSLKVV